MLNYSSSLFALWLSAYGQRAEHDSLQWSYHYHSRFSTSVSWLQLTNQVAIFKLWFSATKLNSTVIQRILNFYGALRIVSEFLMASVTELLAYFTLMGAALYFLLGRSTRKNYPPGKNPQ